MRAVLSEIACVLSQVRALSAGLLCSPSSCVEEANHDVPTRDQGFLELWQQKRGESLGAGTHATQQPSTWSTVTRSSAVTVK